MPTYPRVSAKSRTIDPSGTYVRVFKPEAYGAVGDGTTDDSTAVNAAIQAAYAAGGGTVEFAAKTYRIDSLSTLPNDGHTAIPRQPPLTLAGQGGLQDGQWQSSGTLPGQTVLDLRSTTGPGKIDTRGLGALYIRDMTLTQKGSAADTNPFVYSTNTTVFMERVGFLGHSTLTKATCVQDAIVFGGTTTTLGGGPNDAFQGYGSHIKTCYFARIQRALYTRAYVNSVQFTANTISNTCGGGASVAAVHIDGSYSSGDSGTGNVVTGNLFEVGGYVYVIRLSNAQRNVCTGNQFLDPSVSLVAVFLLEATTTWTQTRDNHLGTALAFIPDAKILVDNAFTTSYCLQHGSEVITQGDYLAGAITDVKPYLARGSESAKVMRVMRSNAEATNAAASILDIQNNGQHTAGGTWSTAACFIVKNGSAQLTHDSTGLVKNTGDCELWAGATTDAVRVRRGRLQADSGLRLGAAGANHFSGTGAPTIAGTAGDWYWRTDTPSTANQRAYICTVTGIAGAATWVGVV